MFCTRSVTTDPVTSLEIQPIRGAFMLCQFGRTQNANVAASSATSGHVVVPERFGQNDEPVFSNEERTRRKRSFVLKVD